MIFSSFFNFYNREIPEGKKNEALCSTDFKYYFTHPLQDDCRYHLQTIFLGVNSNLKFKENIIFSTRTILVAKSFELYLYSHYAIISDHSQL